MDLDKLSNVDTSELDTSDDLDDGVYEEIGNGNTDGDDDSLDDKLDDIFDDNDENEEIDNDSDDDDDTLDDEDSDQGNNTDEDSGIVVNDTTDADSDDSTMLIDLGDSKVEVKDTDELQAITKTALKGDKRYKQYKDDIAVLEGIKEEGLSTEDLYLLVEAKKGNKQALAKLLKDSGVDPLDLDNDEDVENYKPSEYKVDPNYVETKAIISELQKDETVYNQFENLLMKDFDDEARRKAFNDPSMLEFIGETVKAGIFEQLAPKYMKNKLLGKGNALEAYIAAYDEFAKEAASKVQKATSKVQTDSKAKATKRKKASEGSRKKVSTKPKTKSVDDMTDTEFEEYYRQKVGDF